MGNTIKVRGSLVSPDKKYHTKFGETVTRQELYEKYAQTIQHCLCWGTQYALYSGAELIMRAVIALLDPDGVTCSQNYIVEMLTCGLRNIGYKLVPDDGVIPSESELIIPALYLGCGTFPDKAEKYTDFCTSESIGGHKGLLHYLDVISECAEQSRECQCDEAIVGIVQAIRLLILPDPKPYNHEIEFSLWNAAKALGYKLEMVGWYQEMLEKSAD